MLALLLAPSSYHIDAPTRHRSATISRAGAPEMRPLVNFGDFCEEYEPQQSSTNEYDQQLRPMILESEDAPMTSSSVHHGPGFTIDEGEMDFTIRAHFRGVKADGLSISIVGRMLVATGETVTVEGGLKVITTVERQIRLPETAIADGAGVAYEDGEAFVTLSKGATTASGASWFMTPLEAGRYVKPQAETASRHRRWLQHLPKRRKSAERANEEEARVCAEVASADDASGRSATPASMACLFDPVYGAVIVDHWRL